MCSDPTGDQQLRLADQVVIAQCGHYRLSVCGHIAIRRALPSPLPMLDDVGH